MAAGFTKTSNRTFGRLAGRLATGRSRTLLISFWPVVRAISSSRGFMFGVEYSGVEVRKENEHPKHSKWNSFNLLPSQ